MKNRRKLRKIIVDGKEYLWSYNYDDMDFSDYPHSYYVFVPKEFPALKVRVYFKKYAPQMKISGYLYNGTPCRYNDEEIVMNLCRPYFAAQMISYVFGNICRDAVSGEINIENGDDILRKLGYSDFE